MVNGNAVVIFNDLDKTDVNEYDYKVEIVGEVSGYKVTMSPSGKTIILTKKINTVTNIRGIKR